MNTSASVADRYLRDLTAALDAVPDAAREAILEDVRAHLADAEADGRDLSATIAALGTPEAVARGAREQFGLPAASDPSGSARRFLHWAAAAVALVTAAIVSFILPSYAIELGAGTIDQTGSPILTGSTLFDSYGMGVALLPLIPVAVALVPLALRGVAGVVSGWVIAAATTIAAIVTAASIGAFYVPLALMLWAAVLVPLWIERGRPSTLGRGARIAGAVVLAAPVAYTFSGLITGALVDATWAFWLVALLLIALAVIFALRVRFADLVVAFVGAGLMLVGVIDAGLLLIAFWWAGGLWLAIGASGAVARHSIRAPQNR